ncbi:MAG: hypothetical protein H0V51_08135, partial [Chloroflexi bacterium]|nr:hypothetical protein [Chloroflexota bacterium]
YYELRPDYAQLNHAFEWAIAHDLALAFGLAAKSANLQAGFNLVRDSHTWAVHLVAAARRTGDDQIIGAAFGTLGNAHARMATLPDEPDTPGQSRRARLFDALAAYDEALKHRRPEVVPLDDAMTLGNVAISLCQIANISGEDRRGRLAEALRCAYTALAVFVQMEHGPYIRQTVGLLRGIRVAAGELFAELWAELAVGEPPEWLADGGPD